MIEDFAAVAFGGALGAVVRALLIRWTASLASLGSIRGIRFEPTFATILPNALGCMILGFYLFSPAFPSLPGGDEARGSLTLLLTTGICGGLTTFSTLCADGVRLGEGPGLRSALLYLAITLGTGFLAFNLFAPAGL